MREMINMIEMSARVLVFVLVLTWEKGTICRFEASGCGAHFGWI